MNKKYKKIISVLLIITILLQTSCVNHNSKLRQNEKLIGAGGVEFVQATEGMGTLDTLSDYLVKYPSLQQLEAIDVKRVQDILESMREYHDFTRPAEDYDILDLAPELNQELYFPFRDCHILGLDGMDYLDNYYTLSDFTKLDNRILSAQGNQYLIDKYEQTLGRQEMEQLYDIIYNPDNALFTQSQKDYWKGFDLSPVIIVSTYEIGAGNSFVLNFNGLPPDFPTYQGVQTGAVFSTDGSIGQIPPISQQPLDAERGLIYGWDQGSGINQGWYCNNYMDSLKGFCKKLLEEQNKDLNESNIKQLLSEKIDVLQDLEGTNGRMTKSNYSVGIDTNGYKVHKNFLDILKKKWLCEKEDIVDIVYNCLYLTNSTHIVRTGYKIESICNVYNEIVEKWYAKDNNNIKDYGVPFLARISANAINEELNTKLNMNAEDIDRWIEYRFTGGLENKQDREGYEGVRIDREHNEFDFTNAYYRFFDFTMDLQGLLSLTAYDEGFAVSQAILTFIGYMNAIQDRYAPNIKYRDMNTKQRCAVALSFVAGHGGKQGMVASHIPEIQDSMTFNEVWHLCCDSISREYPAWDTEYICTAGLFVNIEENKESIYTTIKTRNFTMTGAPLVLNRTNESGMHDMVRRNYVNFLFDVDALWRDDAITQQ